MLGPKYATVPTDRIGKPLLRGTRTGFDFTFQEFTFGASIVMQVVTLVLTAIAMGASNVPNILMTVIVLELVVQVVELIWYSTVGALYLWAQQEINIKYRYLDWVITTPVMITSIFFFTVWDADKACIDSTSAFFNDSSRVIALVVMLVMNMIMLAVGAAYEVPVEWAKELFDQVALGMKDAGLYLGFVPFAGIFTPLFVATATSFSIWGFISILVMFFTWLLYGVVAILGNINYMDEEGRNAFYNLLDIFSKNIVGIVISTVSITGNFTDVGTCNATVV